MTSPRRRSEGDPPLKVIENQIKNKDTQNELGGASTGKLYVFGITGDNQNEQRINKSQLFDEIGETTEDESDNEQSISITNNNNNNTNNKVLGKRRKDSLETQCDENSNDIEWDFSKPIPPQIANIGRNQSPRRHSNNNTNNNNNKKKQIIKILHAQSEWIKVHEKRIDIIIEPYYTWNTEQSMVECDLTIDILDKWECKDDVYFTISMCARSSEYLGGTPIKNNDIQMSVFNSIDVSNSILFTQDMRELPIKLTFKGNVFNSKKRKTLLLKVIADSKFRNVFKPEFKSIVIVEEGYEYNPADKNLYRPSDGPRGRKAKASKAKVGRPKGSKTKGRGGGRGGGGG
eukprot:539012_1